MHLAFVIALGCCLWDAINLQLKWNAANQVSALVVDIEPPPPEPFGNSFQLTYEDKVGEIHTVTMDRMDFYVQPELDQQITIHYWDSSPSEPLGPSRVNDVGFNRGVLRSSVVLAIYCLMLLIAPLYLKQRQAAR